ncbi:hypothetical protein B0H11DRAFT_2286491 [Mycena galericulata]|nr:hypothetical protein B0H11DRAFT_2286491 [Mycena galericulata]
MRWLRRIAVNTGVVEGEDPSVQAYDRCVPFVSRHLSANFLRAISPPTASTLRVLLPSPRRPALLLPRTTPQLLCESLNDGAGQSIDDQSRQDTGGDRPRKRARRFVDSDLDDDEEEVPSSRNVVDSDDGKQVELGKCKRGAEALQDNDQEPSEEATSSKRWNKKRPLISQSAIRLDHPLVPITDAFMCNQCGQPFPDSVQLENHFTPARRGSKRSRTQRSANARAPAHASWWRFFPIPSPPRVHPPEVEVELVEVEVTSPSDARLGVPLLKPMRSCTFPPSSSSSSAVHIDSGAPPPSATSIQYAFLSARPASGWYASPVRRTRSVAIVPVREVLEKIKRGERQRKFGPPNRRPQTPPALRTPRQPLVHPTG